MTSSRTTTSIYIAARFRVKPRGTTFKNEYFCELEKEFKNILGCEFGDYGVDSWKKPEAKNLMLLSLQTVKESCFIVH
jgi:hypothetical protein